MKILFLINSLKIGGAERAFITQSAALNKLGAQVWLGTLYGQKNSSIFLANVLPEVKLVDFHFRHWFDLVAWWRYVVFLRRHQIEVVYATLDHATIVARLAKIFVPHTRVVIRESGIADRKTWKSKLVDLVLNFFASSVVAVSAEVRDSLGRYQPLYSAKIKVLENGVAPVALLTKGSAKTDRHPEVVLLNVGSMDNPNKGQAGIIESLGDLSRSFPDLNFRLVLVGGGKLRSQLEELSRENNLQSRVRFTGPLAPGALAQEYLAADIFVLNSETEGFPNVVLEAMNYGLPVVATRVGGVTRAVVSGETGFLFEPGRLDVLQKILYNLIVDIKLRASWGRAGRERVMAEFSLEKTSYALVAILSS